MPKPICSPCANATSAWAEQGLTDDGHPADICGDRAGCPCQHWGVTRPDYIQTYETFWREIVEHLDGTLNRDQIMRELSDYRTVMEQVSLAYDEVTGGRISKPNTAAFHVVGEVEERVQAAVEEARKESEEESRAEVERLRGEMHQGQAAWLESYNEVKDHLAAALTERDKLRQRAEHTAMQRDGWRQRAEKAERERDRLAEREKLARDIAAGHRDDTHPATLGEMCHACAIADTLDGGGAP